MIYRLLLLILLCCQFLFVKANPTIHVSGRLLDSVSQTPLSDGVINFLQSEKPITISKSDSHGYFSFTTNERENLILEIRVMGYATKTIRLNSADLQRDSLKIGDILLRSKERKLQEVVVTGKQNLMKQEIGKIIYNVQGDPENQFQNMFDMLRKVPLISMGTEDEILMAGKSNFKVLINGKTSALTVGKPSDIFKTIPAKLVQKIEVITQPPAKYDGEGIGGILNVVMDQKLIQGYIAGINGGVGKMNSNASGNFAIRSNKISLSTFINSFWEYPPESSLTSRIESGAEMKNVIEQSGILKNRAHSRVGAITFGYELDTLNLITIGGNLKKNQNDKNSMLSTFIQKANDANISFVTDNDFESNTTGGSFDLNYERGFKRNKKQLLTFSFNYNKQKTKQSGQNSYSQRSNFEDQDFSQLNNAYINERIFQIDYVHPIKSMEMSLGGKYTSRNGESAFNSFIPNSDGLIPNTEETNRFQNKQQIYGVYNSYNIKLNDWGISLGARLEGTQNEANFYATNTGINQKYHNLIPSVQLLRKFKNVSSINIGYTQRIQRPDVNLMNPFVNKSDPTFYFTGNPELLPVTNHAFSFSYSWFKKGFVNIGTNYSTAKNTIQRIIELREDNISYSTYYNIGADKRLDVNLSTNYPLTKVISLTVNGTLSYVNVNGSVQGNMYKNDGMQGNAYMYLNYTIPKIVGLSGNLGYYSPTVILQGSSKGYLYSSISASTQILKNKLTISSSISNPLQQYRMVENRIYTADFSQLHAYKHYFRNFSLNLSYNFGKLEKPIKKNKKGIKTEDKIENSEKNEKGANN